MADSSGAELTSMTSKSILPEDQSHTEGVRTQPARTPFTPSPLVGCDVIYGRSRCTASIYQKILRLIFDLIYARIINSSIFYLSELIKFELIITIFERNCVYLSSQN